MFTCGNCRKEFTEGQFCPHCGSLAPRIATKVVDPPRDPVVGQTVAGKYRILRLIDRGGMGAVYEATHLSLERPVALKMLNHELLADPALIQRFHREARAASRLNHPNSVGVLDFGETEDGTLFMAMELVPGGRTLARVIADETPLGTARIVKIGSQILAALTEAHGLGILHCDLKPQNVMLDSRRDETDVVKVVDFGIAKLLGGGDGTRLTRVGTVVGTPGYMSPEQAQGEVLDPRSDLYSVGVILYEMVTGRLPFSAPAPIGLIGKMLSEKPTPPSVLRPGVVVPPDLEALVMRALSVDRQSRPASAEEFRRQLLACLTADGLAKPATPRAMLTFAVEPLAGGSAPPPARSTPAAGSAPRTQQGSPALAIPGAPSVPRTPPGSTSLAEPAAPPVQPRARGEILRALPQLLGSVVVAVAIGGAIVWAVGGEEGAGAFTPTEAARPPVPAGQVSRPDLASPVATASTRAAAPAPAPSPRPQAPAPERAIPEPSRGARRPQASAVPVAPRLPPPSATGAPDSLVLPPSESGEGILTVVAEPGAILLLNGTPVGETPREVRIREGSYRVQVRHAVFGSVRASLKVEAGARKRWEVAFPK